MNDEESIIWNTGMAVLRPEYLTFGGDVIDRIKISDGATQTTETAVSAADAAEAAFHRRLEAAAKVSALKAQMEQEMERRRRELAEHNHYDENPEFGAF